MSHPGLSSYSNSGAESLMKPSKYEEEAIKEGGEFERKPAANKDKFKK